MASMFCNILVKEAASFKHAETRSLAIIINWECETKKDFKLVKNVIRIFF